MGINVESFGRIESSDGLKEVYCFTLSNGSGMTVKLISYGAAITSFCVKDGNGNNRDIILGFDDIQGYLEKRGSNPFFGATIGRVANRIRNGTFSIDGENFQLSVNRGEHHLHGGYQGFDKKLWDYSVEDDNLILSYTSKNGEEGYPGELRVKVTYKVTNDNELCISYEATTTKPTPISLTNHSHFNLAGHEAGTDRLKDHIIVINGNKYTPVDTSIVPTGEEASVENTIYDLRTPKNLHNLLNKFPQGPNGYDINFCISKVQLSPEACLSFVGSVMHTVTKLKMEVFTDQPGVQLYTCNFLPDPDNNEPSIIGKGDQKYAKHGAFCLETQNYPNAINEPGFPNAILRPGEIYKRSTVYKISISQ